jgi:ubiquitin-protein ligase
MADKGKREKNLHRLIQELKNMGPGSNEVIKFIVDKTPSEDDDESLPSGDWIISGRLLPNSDLYKQGSLPARIVVGPTFPVQPPKVLITVPIYHPNVAKDG